MLWCTTNISDKALSAGNVFQLPTAAAVATQQEEDEGGASAAMRTNKDSLSPKGHEDNDPAGRSVRLEPKWLRRTTEVPQQKQVA